jgi:molybdate transport system substrate-binding protein
MTMRLFALAATVAALALGAPAHAAEVKLFSTNASKSILAALGPEFEKASGHKIVVTFGIAVKLQSEIAQGAVVDAALLTEAGIDELVKQGKLASRTSLVRSGIGMAIKKGAPKPDISSAESFKQALLAAKSIAIVDGAASGTYLRSLFERLGIAEQLKPKLKPVVASAPAVAAGEAEIGFTQVAEILPYAGAELAGPLPVELQNYTDFSLGVAKDSKPGEAFVRFMTTPQAAAVIKAKGFETR